MIGSYVHNKLIDDAGQIGVLVSFDGDKAIADEVAWHIAAMKP